MAVERHKNTLDYEKRALGTLAHELTESDKKSKQFFRPSKSRNKFEQSSALTVLSRRAPSYITQSSNRSRLNRFDEKQYDLGRNDGSALN